MFIYVFSIKLYRFTGCVVLHSQTDLGLCGGGSHEGHRQRSQQGPLQGVRDCGAKEDCGGLCVSAYQGEGSNVVFDKKKLVGNFFVQFLF